MLPLGTREQRPLGIFRADLISFTRYYEFLSQIVDCDSTDLEKLNLCARHLAPLLREDAAIDEPFDLASVDMPHFRLSKIKQQDLLLVKKVATGLQVGPDIGASKPNSK